MIKEAGSRKDRRKLYWNLNVGAGLSTVSQMCKFPDVTDFSDLRYSWRGSLVMHCAGFLGIGELRVVLRVTGAEQHKRDLGEQVNGRVRVMESSCTS